MEEHSSLSGIDSKLGNLTAADVLNKLLFGELVPKGSVFYSLELLDFISA